MVEKGVYVFLSNNRAKWGKTNTLLIRNNKDSTHRWFNNYSEKILMYQYNWIGISNKWWCTFNIHTFFSQPGTLLSELDKLRSLLDALAWDGLLLELCELLEPMEMYSAWSSSWGGREGSELSTSKWRGYWARKVLAKHYKGNRKKVPNN